MATTGHESEIIQVQGLKAALKDGGNKGLFNEATCSTAAATAAKTVDAPTSFSLVSGATIIVKFTNAISVASATLKVGSTDAKPIYYRGAALAKNLVAAGDRLILRYNGTQYDILGHINTDTNTKVTSVANHYAPAADSGSELSASASGATASWGIDVVKGVQVQRDAKGHVTGITVTSGKTPANPLPSNTVTGSGLTADKIVLGNGNSAVKTSSKGITTTNPSANSTNDDLPTSKAVWGAIADGIAANDAMVYKGTIAGGSTGSYGALTAAANRGWTYKVSTAGKIDGIAVEVGDMIICNTDSTAAATSSNYSTIAAKWDYIQANVDGVLFKSSNTFTDGHVLVADSTAGKVKDSGYTIGKSVPSNAVFTDASVTSSANHYTPSTVSGQDKSASASGATASWSIDVVKGITLNTDGKGHVTGVSVTSGKIPAAPTVMGASGTNHKGGLVPDPGATQGTTKYLREDGTWTVPDKSDKADKDTDAVAGNIAKFDANGNPVDAGIALTDVAQKATTLAGYGISDAYTKSETYTKTEVNGLVRTPHQNYVTVATYADLPATGSADTIYRVSNWDGSANSGAGAVDVTVYSEYAWDDQSNPNKYVFLCVKSQIGEVFDISVYNNNAKYDTLADALGTNGEHVPQSIRRGGMSVKYVQNSDNKYVQFRCMSDDFSTNVEDWVISVEGKYVEDGKFIWIKLDGENKIIVGIERNGNIFYGAGVPQQVKDYINEKITELHLDKVPDIVTFLGNLLTGDKTLSTLLNEKVDKEEGKSLINEDYANNIDYVDNPNYTRIEIDKDSKIMSYRRKPDGVKVEKVGLIVEGKTNLQRKNDYIVFAENVSLNPQNIFIDVSMLGKMFFVHLNNQSEKATFFPIYFCNANKVPVSAATEYYMNTNNTDIANRNIKYGRRYLKTGEETVFPIINPNEYPFIQIRTDTITEGCNISVEVLTEDYGYCISKNMNTIPFLGKGKMYIQPKAYNYCHCSRIANIGKYLLVNMNGAAYDSWADVVHYDKGAFTTLAIIEKGNYGNVVYKKLDGYPSKDNSYLYGLGNLVMCAKDNDLYYSYNVDNGENTPTKNVTKIFSTITFEFGSVQDCYLKYTYNGSEATVQWTKSNEIEMLNRLYGFNIPDCPNAKNETCDMRYYNGYFYRFISGQSYATSEKMTAGIQPWVLIKSSDCITWEPVACVRSDVDSRSAELSFDIYNDIILVQIRSMYNYCGYMVCDINGNVLKAPTQLYVHDSAGHRLYFLSTDNGFVQAYNDGTDNDPVWKKSHDAVSGADEVVIMRQGTHPQNMNGLTSKGAVFIKKGVLYLVFNFKPYYADNNYYGRQAIQIAALNTGNDYSLNVIKSFVDMDGFQYYDFNCYDDRVFVSNTEDPRAYNYGQIGPYGGCSISVLSEEVFYGYR